MANQQERYNQFMAEQQQSQSQHSGNYPIDNPQQQSPVQNNMVQPPQGYQLPPNSNGYPASIYNPQFQQPQQPQQQPISSGQPQQQHRFMAYQAPAAAAGYNVNPGFIPQGFQRPVYQPDPTNAQLTPQQEQQQRMMYDMMYLQQQQQQQQQQPRPDMPYNMMRPSPPLQQQQQNIPMQHMVPPPPQFTNDMNPQVYQQRLHQYRQMIQMQQFNYMQHHQQPSHPSSDQRPPYPPPHPQYIQHQFRPTPQQYQQQMNMQNIRTSQFQHHQQLQLQHHNQQQQQQQQYQPARRSARATKKKKSSYEESSDEEELNLSEDSEPEPEELDESDDEDGSRKRRKGDDDSDEPIVIPMGTKEFERILDYRQNEDTGKEELLIKYKYTSFHHVDWVPIKQVEAEHLGKHRVKKFLRKWEEDGQRGEDFREYLKLDRIVDEGEIEDPTTGELKIYYLCKWNASFYDSCTWEKEEDAEKIDESKVEEFHDRRIIPDYKMENPPHRPDLSKFMKYDRSPTYRYGNELRSYQLEGLNWLRFCYYSYRSCILADEMGLGKTVQSVALLNDIYHVLGIKGPFIIIAPLSTIPHWERAFKAWTDLNVIDYRGSNLARNLIVDTEFYYKNTEGKNIPDRYKFDVLITTYEMASSSAPLLSKIRWKCAVFDEAHRLKNKQSKVLEILKTFYIEHKLLLTGTPLQNNLDELYSLLSFMQPEVFNDEAYFFSEYGSLQTAAQVEKLQALLKPIMLRRFKEDVEKTIPVKEETVVEVELTTPQKKWYRAILEKNFSFLKKGAKSNKEMPHLRNIMMQLRKCCIHPYLLEGAEEVIVSECNAVSPQDQFSCLVQSSGKLVLIDKLLKKLILGNHKVLIFSQFTSCLDILSDYLRKRKYAFERIDGTIPGDQRQAAIDRFSTLPIEESFVFLLCTRAGGVGINLTAADTCIIFDSDWNPQNDLQAQARCHRIGQTKPVQIYRLICANTYEKDMFDRAGMKLGLDKAVMSRSGPTGDNENGQSGKHELTKQEIEALLKKGAYGAMLDDEASTRFCEEDIDQILERRTKVIKHEGNEQGSVFSKATFSAGSGDVDGVDIDDPDFWEKWAAKANIDTTEVPEEKNKLILLGSRRRRQVQRFGTKQEDSNYSDNENEDSDGAYEDEDDDDEEGGRRRNNEEDGEEEEEGVGRRGRGRGARSSTRGGVTTRRGRGRRAASSAVSSPSNNNSGVGRKRGNGAGREGAPRLWTLSEKTKYERKLMIFGYGAWEQMKADFPRRSEKDLKAVTRILMKRTLPTIGKKTEEDKKLVDDIEQLLESDSKDDVPNDDTVPYKNATKKQISEFRSFLIDATDDYIDHIERKGRNLLLRIQMLHIIRDKIVPKNWSVAKTMSMPQVAGAQPAKWWGKDEDRSLILGICKHGYQQYLDIRNDPEFCFYGKKYEDNDEDDEAATANNAKMDEEDEGGSGSDRETPSNEESKNAEKSATSAAEDEEVVIKEDEDSNVESTAADASIDNKNEQADDGDDEKDETYKDEAETAEDDGTVYVWPSKAEIGMRLRRVIAACIRVQSQDQRKRKAPAERKAPAARRVRRRGGGPGRRGGRPRRNTAAATEDVEESEDDTISVNNENNNVNTATTPTAVGEEDEKEESVEKTESSTNKAEKEEDTIDGKKEEKDQSITHEEDIKVKRENNNNTEDGDNNKTVGIETTISEPNSNDVKKDMKAEQPVEEKDKVIKSETEEGGAPQLTTPIKEEEDNSNEINNGRVDQVDSKDHVAEDKGSSIDNHQQQDGELSKDDKDELQTVPIKVNNEKAMLDKETDLATSTQSEIIAVKVDSIDDSNSTRSVDDESTKDVSTDVKDNE